MLCLASSLDAAGWSQAIDDNFDGRSVRHVAVDKCAIYYAIQLQLQVRNLFSAISNAFHILTTYTNV